MSGHRTRQCAECGVHDSSIVDGLMVILGDYGNDGREWLLCDDCAERLRDYWDEQETQQCTNNWIMKGVY